MNPAEKLWLALLLTIAVIPLLTGCDRSATTRPVYELSGATMGTTYSIKIASQPDAIDMDTLAADLETAILDVEARMSTYIPTSEISRFNALDGSGWFSASPGFCEAVAGALQLGERTGGAFDITVGPLVDLWGFGPGDRIEAPPDDALIESTRVRTGYRNVEADCSRPAIRKTLPAVSIDLSAYAKGFAVDRATQRLVAAGVEDFLVEIGGELRAAGHNARGEPWAIAVERPVAGGRSIQAVYPLTNSAMATSGDYRNFFDYDGVRYSHTIDPRTGRPVRHDGASVTVIADRGADADGLATALLVMGPERGAAFAERESIAAYFLVRKDDDVEERQTAEFVSRTQTAPGRDRQ